MDFRDCFGSVNNQIEFSRWSGSE